jgi:homoserine O-acetyltransferase
MDALMPLACQPVAIVGRNRLWRQMAVNAIENDPEWKGGDYEREPSAGLRTAVDLLLIAGSAPIYLQNTLATRDTVDGYLTTQLTNRMATTDANDLVYQLEASRNYDPSPKLESIVAPVMFVNSADDFINPPELGIAEREVKRVKRATFVLIPASDKTRGHGSHTWAALWKQHLASLLQQSHR